MIIGLNGSRTELPAGATLADAIAAAGADSDLRGVAAAVAGEVVPQPRWEEWRLHEGEEVEVVRAVQGG